MFFNLIPFEKWRSSRRLTTPLFASSLLILFVSLGTTTAYAQEQIFEVTAVGTTAYAFAGLGDSPTLTLQRGKTYRFNVDVGGIHPFWITTAPDSGSGGAYNDGVTGNGATNGPLTFVVPMSAPDMLYYDCDFHTGQGGVVEIIDAPPAVPGLSTIGQMMLILLLMTGVTLGMASHTRSGIGS